MEIDYKMLPENLSEGLQGYIEQGIPPGHFLQAILKNNLVEACARADIPNQRRIYDVVFFLHNYAPSACWGSTEKYESWIRERRRLEPPV